MMAVKQFIDATRRNHPKYKEHHTRRAYHHLRQARIFELQSALARECGFSSAATLIPELNKRAEAERAAAARAANTTLRNLKTWERRFDRAVQTSEGGNRG